MKKLIEMRNRKKAELQAMLDKVKTEERAFTEEENTQFNTLESEIKQLDATIEAEERAQGISDRKAAEPAAQTKQPTQEELEERAFTDFLNGRVQEMRAGEQNIDWTNGASTIPTSIAKRIIDTVVDMCPILSGAEVYHEKGTLKIPKWTKANSTHDVTVGYASEFTPLTADSGKFTSVDLSGYLAGALVLVGKSVINSSAINVTQFVINKIAEKVAQFLEGELLNGSGSSAAQGATKTSNVVTTGTALTVGLDDLIAVQAAVKQKFQKNACWTMNSTTWTAIKMLKDDNGRPLIEPDPSVEFPYRLLGKPVHLSDNMDSIAANKLAILYGDYSGLSVNFREDIGIEVLREAYHTQHAIGIDAWFEFDSKITNEQKLAVLKVKAS
ncbi:phage major capsid protein [Ruminococcus sp.]|uniref:phage major capsid protein n=1 Tax=Ruminococcus sp. TaxID=41978 RepID=UPI001B70DFEA|nr:phage major capsid protein [Ruminococcus sp.]MBP5431617.1 phage major capsid protein [Ruminococcus sp.]